MFYYNSGVHHVFKYHRNNNILLSLCKRHINIYVFNFACG